MSILERGGEEGSVNKAPSVEDSNRISNEIPGNLKPIAHFVKIANEYAEVDSIICYWCLLKALEDGVELNDLSPQEVEYLKKIAAVLNKVGHGR